MSRRESELDCFHIDTTKNTLHVSKINFFYHIYHNMTFIGPINRY
jgi:hypothetical protein